ncbi:hypothetical protein GCM10010381_41580 [Streptomyces xantholiticus]|nr:hypothetical protein GCM10010381_41580 [Streptomyces xantholiticus]
MGGAGGRDEDRLAGGRARVGFDAAIGCADPRVPGALPAVASDGRAFDDDAGVGVFVRVGEVHGVALGDVEPADLLRATRAPRHDADPGGLGVVPGVGDTGVLGGSNVTEPARWFG